VILRLAWPRRGSISGRQAELVFGSGLLAGMKLVGFSLWKSPEGELYVTFPSRAFGTASEQRCLFALYARSSS